MSKIKYLNLLIPLPNKVSTVFLGPFLCLVMINVLDLNVILFADDATFNFSDNSVENVNLFLSNEMFKANKLCCANEFLLNSDKTQSSNFCLDLRYF